MKSVTSKWWCLMGLAALAASSVVADECAEVVAATEAEMRLAAGSDWSDGRAATVRAAAASACLKATSGRYGASAAVREESLDDDDDSDWGFEPLSGSPAKKPFERSRSSSD